MNLMRTRSGALAALVAAAILLQGCATLLKGAQEEVMVNSDPSGAQVSVNDEEMTGATPYVVNAKSSQPLHIHVSKQGYKPQDITDDTSFRWGYEFLSFLCYVLPVGVDLADGAAWGHDQTMIAAHLEPNAQSTPATAPEAAMPQAETASGAAPSPAAAASTVTTAPIAVAAPPIPAPPAVAHQQPAAQTPAPQQ